jgi:hypothetical protein
MANDNNDQIPEDPKVIKATAKAIASLDKAADTSVGAQVFHQIEAMNLTNDQKQQIYRNLAEDVTTKACTDLKDPAILMRGSSAGSQFMTAYLRHASRLAGLDRGHECRQCSCGPTWL